MIYGGCKILRIFVFFRFATPNRHTMLHMHNPGLILGFFGLLKRLRGWYPCCSLTTSWSSTQDNSIFGVGNISVFTVRYNSVFGRSYELNLWYMLNLQALSQTRSTNSKQLSPQILVPTQSIDFGYKPRCGLLANPKWMIPQCFLDN